MATKSRKPKAPSAEGPTKVAKAEVGKAEPAPTKEPKQTITSQFGGGAAVDAVCEFYDKLVELPLEERLPALLSHHLITRSTLERVGKPCYIRTEKNGFILEDVLATVQQKPDMLEVFCNVLRDIFIAAELAQQIKGKFEASKQLEQRSASARLSISRGPDVCQRMFQGWCLILILLVVFLGISLVSYIAAQQVSGKPAKWQVRVPPIPTAFTGRENDIQRIVDLLVQEDVGIVSITGGPGYGKSSVAIASSHQLMEHGIPVCYVSLSEADSIETFIMTLLHALTRKTERDSDKLHLLSWVGLLKEKTVIVLDNADLLTLKETELRHDFIKLLKDIVTESAHLHLVVATRYRFKITTDFEEIHLHPLASFQALSLLKCLMHASGHVDEELTEQLQMITNATGGIPLAIQIVGQLVKSGVSVVEVTEDLSIDPVSALSEDSFTPEEQLERCINLSYKHLSPLGQKCFLFAASFPGSFDRKAKKNIIANLTGDGHCLNQLVDRSLVEYNAVTSRYDMHALLRAFARDSGITKISLKNYYELHSKHYAFILTEQFKGAKSHGNISGLYTTLVVDYHNFLQLLHTLSGNTTSSLSRKEEIELAVQTFHTMQSQFPRDALLGWWKRILWDVCEATDFPFLAPHFIDLSTKLAQLFSYHQIYSVAKRTLLFAHKCVLEDDSLASSFHRCDHPQLNSYTTMLQVLAHVCEMEGAVDEALVFNQTIQRCLRLTPSKKVDEIIPHNFCSDGVDHLRKVYENFKDLASALQLFDALLQCSKSEAMMKIKLLEDAFELQLAQPQIHSTLPLAVAAVRISKHMNQISNHEGEAKWLMRSVEYMESAFFDIDFLAFAIYFRLTRLYWHVLNDKVKALEIGKAAFAKAMNLSSSHFPVLKASVRLADILNQIDGCQEEAAFYFQQAFDRLPYINVSADVLYKYHHFIKLNLDAFHFQSREFSMFFQHFGQWDKLAREATEATQDPDTRQILDMYYNYLYEQLAKSSSLTTYNTFNLPLTGFDAVWQFIKACIGQVQDSSVWYAHFVLYRFLEVLHGARYLYRLCKVCVSTYTTEIVAVLPAGLLLLPYMTYVAPVLIFNFHYFLYVAIVKHKLWKPKRLPALTILLHFVSIKKFFIAVFILLLFEVVLFTANLVFAKQFHSWRTKFYHNASMDIHDDALYADELNQLLLKLSAY